MRDNGKSSQVFGNNPGVTDRLSCQRVGRADMLHHSSASSFAKKMFRSSPRVKDRRLRPIRISRSVSLRAVAYRDRKALLRRFHDSSLASTRDDKKLEIASAAFLAASLTSLKAAVTFSSSSRSISRTPFFENFIPYQCHRNPGHGGCTSSFARSVLFAQSGTKAARKGTPRVQSTASQGEERTYGRSAIQELTEIPEGWVSPPYVGKLNPPNESEGDDA